MAHAGASGNSSSEIRALKFEPIQLRIAQAIARSPDRNKPGNNHSAGPETARIIEGKIRISGSEPD
jgi:septum site-determining protein MinC